MAKTPWVDEGPLRARFWNQSTGSKLSAELVREVNQPDRDKIMANTQEMAKEGTPLAQRYSPMVRSIRGGSTR